MELYDRLSRARQLLEQRKKIVSDNETFLATLKDMPVTASTVRAALTRQKVAVLESQAAVGELEKAAGVLPLKSKT